MTNICFLRHPWDSTGRSSWSTWLGWSSLLGPGSLESEPWWWGTVLPGFPGPVTHNLGVDGAAHAVAELSIQLGQLIAGVDWCLGDVSHCSGLNNVPDDELLDGLVLRHTLGAVGATDGLDMAPSVLVTAVVATLGCHSLVEVNQAILAWSF